MFGIRRREFITLLGGAAVACPLTARAQQAAMPVIGFMNTASPGPFANLVAAFRKGLEETGYVEGRDVMVEYRWAEGRYDRLSAFAAELVRGVAGGFNSRRHPYSSSQLLGCAQRGRCAGTLHPGK